MQSPGSAPHICPRFGEQEVWELVNLSGELHNFHIHQSKFRLSVASDPGVPPGPLGITDPGNVLVNSDTDAVGATPDAGVDVWHDTLPVPPAGPSGPGRVFVTIPFHARQQIGFFVFHCHILEHEDNGMMAVVQVFDPAHPKLTADMEPAGGMHAMPSHLPYAGISGVNRLGANAARSPMKGQTLPAVTADGRFSANSRNSKGRRSRSGAGWTGRYPSQCTSLQRCRVTAR